MNTSKTYTVLGIQVKDMKALADRLDQASLRAPEPQGDVAMTLGVAFDAPTQTSTIRQGEHLFFWMSLLKKEVSSAGVNRLVSKLVDERTQKGEKVTGRDKKDIKEEVIRNALRSALVSEKEVPVIVSKQTGKIYVGATGASADTITLFIILNAEEHIEKISVWQPDSEAVFTQLLPSLGGDPVCGMSLIESITLKARNEQPGSAVVKNMNLSEDAFRPLIDSMRIEKAEIGLEGYDIQFLLNGGRIQLTSALPTPEPTDEDPLALMRDTMVLYALTLDQIVEHIESVM